MLIPLRVLELHRLCDDCSSRYAMECIQFCRVLVHGRLLSQAVATDGRTLMLARWDESLVVGGDPCALNPVLVPADVCADMLALICRGQAAGNLGEGEMVTLDLTPRSESLSYRFGTRRVTLAFRPGEGRFPDVRQVVEADNASHLCHVVKPRRISLMAQLFERLATPEDLCVFSTSAASERQIGLSGRFDQLNVWGALMPTTDAPDNYWRPDWDEPPEEASGTREDQ